jgi:membrane associated rhomboid family serine protease
MNPYFKTPPVVKNLLIINCLVYLAVTLIDGVNHFCAEYLQLWWTNAYNAPEFHSYQLISYMFLHAGLGHLFGNMFALWMFGRTLEYEIGSKRFLIYYLVCGVGAALIQMGIASIFNEDLTLLGASGAVMGLLLAFGLMHPNNMIYIMPLPFPIKAKWFVIGYAVLELLLGSSGLHTGVAHFAHIGGMLWGLVLLLVWKKQGKIYF